MIKCPNCEGEMNFEPGVQEVVCQYCGTKFNPKELKREIKKSKEENDLEGKSFRCTQCGAKLLTFDETAITFCSYCGSQAMVEDKMIQLEKPDYVIPFKITKEECIKKYKHAVNSNIFVPNYLKDDVVVEKFRGIYMPYSIYKTSYKGPCTNSGSKYSHHSADYDYYDDYDIKCDVDVTFDGISKDLRSDFFDKFSENLIFDLNGKEDYNPNYLIGYYADVQDVDPAIYSDNAINDANQEIGKMMMRAGEFSKYGCSTPSVPLQVDEIKTGMFPFYFLAVRDKVKDRIYYAVVNGQTGEMIVNLPTSIPKYVMFSLIISMIIYGFIFNIYLFNARSFLVPISILGSICTFVLAIQASQIGKMFYHEDDEGYNSKIENSDHPVVKRIKYIYKTLIATILPIIIYAADFYQDYINYGVVIIALILIVLSFGDLIKIHNFLVSNKLPQLKKRGGDESE